MRKPYILVFALFICGCANTGPDPIKMYSGEHLVESQLVTLHPPGFNTAAMVLRIDGETPTSCLVNCMFYKSVQVFPGKHKFTSDILNIPTGKEQNPINANSDKKDRLHPLISTGPLDVNKSGLFNMAYKFDFNETLEAGKHYQLKFATTTTDNDWWQKMVVYWEEIPPK